MRPGPLPCSSHHRGRPAGPAGLSSLRKAPWGQALCSDRATLCCLGCHGAWLLRWQGTQSRTKRACMTQARPCGAQLWEKSTERVEGQAQWLSAQGKEALRDWERRMCCCPPAPAFFLLFQLQPWCWRFFSVTWKAPLFSRWALSVLSPPPPHHHMPSAGLPLA